MSTDPSAMQVAETGVLELRHVDLYPCPPSRPRYQGLISRPGPDNNGL